MSVVIRLSDNQPEVPPTLGYLEQILADESQAPGTRYLAAIQIGTIGGPAAVAVLVRSAGLHDAQALTGIAIALGRVGGASEVSVLSRMRDGGTPVAAARAGFEASLIAYRLDLPGNNLSPPVGPPLTPDPLHAIATIESVAADDDEAALCLRSLGSNSHRIEFARPGMRRLTCGKNTRMLVLSREFAAVDAIKYLTTRKGVPAVLARRIPRTSQYSISRIIFTAPQEDGIRLSGCRSDGEVIFEGHGLIQSNLVHFDIHAVARPGGVPLRVTGSVAQNGDTQFEIASVARYAIEKRQPERVS